MHEICNINIADSLYSRVGISPGEIKLLLKYKVDLRENKRKNKEVNLSSADPRKDLVGFSARKGKRRDQDIRIENDLHREKGLFTDFMDDSIHILLRSDSKGLGLQSGLLLEFAPPLFLKIKAQGLPDQLAFGAVFLIGRSLGLSDELWWKGNSPCLGSTHNAFSLICLT